MFVNQVPGKKPLHICKFHVQFKDIIISVQQKREITDFTGSLGKKHNWEHC